jgi:methyltransferase
VTPAASIALVSAAIVAVAMLGELRVSLGNERVLRRDGAIEPPDPVYGTMRWAYPATFVVMALEGSVGAPAPVPLAIAGAIVFVLAKALKVWAIASLGTRWTFRVLVLPGAPLVTSGPYRWLRHPNYVGVVGELVGFALLVGAWVAGPASLIFFGYLLARRIAAEERALY